MRRSRLGSKKRSRLEICIEILKIIDAGCTKPTRIMYRSNISWVPLSEILRFLMDRGAITVKQTGNRKKYYITEKGKNILRYYDQFTTTLVGRIASLPS